MDSTLNFFLCPCFNRLVNGKYKKIKINEEITKKALLF